MKLLTTIMLTMAVIISYGQQDTAKTVEQKKDTVWTFEGQSSLNFTQGFLENWSQGGENFLSTLLLNDYTISYDKKRASWEKQKIYLNSIVNLDMIYRIATSFFQTSLTSKHNFLRVSTTVAGTIV